MNHNDIRHKLSEYLDGSVTAEEKSSIEEHLKSCAACSDALDELRKTIEHIKALEEVEPPAWMTQKIMATVRSEAERKKSIFERLFFPLSIKLPIQAVVVLFLAVTAYYLSQSINPAEKYAEAPMEVAAKKDALSSGKTAKEEKVIQAPAPRAKQVEQGPGYKSLDMKYEYKKPAPPVPRDKLEAPAPAKPAESTAKGEKEATLEKNLPYNTETGRNLEKVILEKYANGKPKLLVTYELIDSRKVKLSEERFNADGERHGIQKEYYEFGQVKTEAQYGYGRLEWYREFYPDGVKKVGKSDHDWFWLKN